MSKRYEAALAWLLSAEEVERAWGEIKVGLDIKPESEYTHNNNTQEEQ